MRTILFRGQKADTKEWIFGDLIQLEKDFKKVFEILDWSKVDNKRKSKSDLTVISETVGQFTGLNDKNGVKIFEGDIIKVEPFRMPHFISFGKSEKWGMSFCSETKNSIIYLNKIYAESSEVIGNIHDNPELLESSF